MHVLFGSSVQVEKFKEKHMTCRVQAIPFGKGWSARFFVESCRTRLVRKGYAIRFFLNQTDKIIRKGERTNETFVEKNLMFFMLYSVIWIVWRK